MRDTVTANHICEITFRLFTIRLYKRSPGALYQWRNLMLKMGHFVLEIKTFSPVKFHLLIPGFVQEQGQFQFRPLGGVF